MLRPGQQGRLPDARRTGDEQRPAAPGRRPCRGTSYEARRSALAAPTSNGDAGCAQPSRRAHRVGTCAAVRPRRAAAGSRRRDRRLAGPHTQFLAQGAFQPLELPQRAAPIALPSQPRDQCEVRLLVGRDRRPAAPPSGPAAAARPGRAGGAGRGRPRPRSRTGPRAADRRRTRRPPGRRLPGPPASAPPRAERLELSRVDADPVSREQRDRLAGEHQRLGSPQRPARVVRGLVQPRGGLVDGSAPATAGPSPARDAAAGPARGPAIFTSAAACRRRQSAGSTGDVADRDREPAQQGDARRPWRPATSRPSI